MISTEDNSLSWRVVVRSPPNDLSFFRFGQPDSVSNNSAVMSQHFFDLLDNDKDNDSEQRLTSNLDLGGKYMSGFFALKM